MTSKIVSVLCLLLLLPAAGFACGGYSDHHPTLWDVMEIEARVAKYSTDDKASRRDKRVAARVLYRTRAVHARFMKDGRFTEKESRRWAKVVSRSHRSLDRLAKRT